MTDKHVLLQGDCLEVLKTLPSDSLDSLVTDPPAGISFMGKAWDEDKGGRKQWIKWMSDVMTECLRVLNPGAHGLVWAILRTSHWTATALEDAGFEIRAVVTHLFGTGFPKSHNIEKATGDSRFKGVGTALKPASEHWVLVRKSCSEDTIAANVLKHGTGGINIDVSRIVTVDKIASITNQNIKNNAYDSDNAGRERDTIYTQNSEGRFPANLLLSHNPDCLGACTEGCPVKLMYEQADDNVSRFFYVAKASKKDKGERNTHPTVKSSALMTYLIKLITPPGGVVLDPFLGSGSTGVAAIKNGFSFIGIEKEDEYFQIAIKRIENTK